jgi:alpha-galactosidase
MTSRNIFLAALFSSLLSAPTLSNTQNIAPTPPLGWNSWDSYGLTIDEAAYRDNASALAELRQYGWAYAVIDEGWYMENPSARTVPDKKYQLDANGLLIPALNRFPSAAGGAGFKPLADWVHKQGLKFGIHIVRGIPRQVVEENRPIAGSSFHAADAADTTETCPWDHGNFCVHDKASGQPNNDSMLKLYAGWGLDFIKVDCISDHPYRPTEIRQIAAAIQKTGRPIVLSLSPGPTSLKHAAEVEKYAQMWRISDDHWDVWATKKKADGSNAGPMGTRDAFDLLAAWFPYVNPGNFADADMLPFGWLGPNPGYGDARQSRETHDEQRSEYTLWAIGRSPLILGANLTRLDDFTRSLITNQTILFMNQNITYSHPVDAASLPAGSENIRVWRGTIDSPGARGYTEFFAFFNLDEKPVTLRATWQQLGLDGKHKALDAWTDATTKESKEITVTLPPHGSTVYEIR